MVIGNDILTVNNLSKKYNERHNSFLWKEQSFFALHDISFSLVRGQTMGIVGESGCGKSTLARILVRLIPADSGNISFNGTDILKMSMREFAKLRPKIQMISQNPFNSLNPRLKVINSLSDGLRTHGIVSSGSEMRRLLEKIFADCELDSAHLYRYPSELSGGQLQRIAIARALSFDPELLIADEIVSALDIHIQSQIIDLMAQLKKRRNLSIVFISHDLAVVGSISDSVLVMREGEIADSGETGRVFKGSGCPYTKELLNSTVHFTSAMA
jgi:peptide/nickel transport system ATP-binding protein